MKVNWKDPAVEAALRRLAGTMPSREVAAELTALGFGEVNVGTMCVKASEWGISMGYHHRRHAPLPLRGAPAKPAAPEPIAETAADVDRHRAAGRAHRFYREPARSIREDPPKGAPEPARDPPATTPKVESAMGMRAMTIEVETSLYLWLRQRGALTGISAENCAVRLLVAARG